MLPKCGNIIISRVPKVAGKKKNEKNPKAAHDRREYKKARTRKLSAKWEIGRPGLQHDEEKGMIGEWCIENKQSLVAQNVLNSTRFYIDDCTS